MILKPQGQRLRIKLLWAKIPTKLCLFNCSVPVKKVYPYHYWGQICFLTILGFFFTVNQIMHYDCPSTPSLSVSLSKFVEISKLMMSRTSFYSVFQTIKALLIFYRFHRRKCRQGIHKCWVRNISAGQGSRIPSMSDLFSLFYNIPHCPMHN